jgi:hypothetical protein
LVAVVEQVRTALVVVQVAVLVLALVAQAIRQIQVAQQVLETKAVTLLVETQLLVVVVLVLLAQTLQVLHQRQVELVVSIGMAVALQPIMRAVAAAAGIPLVALLLVLVA